MSLTHQFLIALALSGAFIFLIVVSLRRARPELQASRFWLVTLLSGAVWASSIASFYGGASLSAYTAIAWRTVGRHTLSILPFWLLLTTTAYLGLKPRQARNMHALALFLWLLSLVLDPVIWHDYLPAWTLGGQAITQFNVWAATWITSWFVPLFAAILLTRRAANAALSSLYHNRLNYWLLTLLLFLFGGLPGFVQQPGQPAWQELGALALIVAASVGTHVLTSATLTDLRLALRRLAARLTTTLLIFLLTWSALWFFARSMPADEAQSAVLDLTFAAAALAALFMLLNRLVPRLIQHLFLAGEDGDSAPDEQLPLAGTVLDVAGLAELTLRQMETKLGTAHASLFAATECEDGAILLQPVATLGEGNSPEAFTLARTSPVLQHLRQEPGAALSRYELEVLPVFDELPAGEKTNLLRGQTALLVPLQAGSYLAGMVALSERASGEPYSSHDLAWLHALAFRSGPLLLQARQIAALEQLHKRLSGELERHAEKNQQLVELLDLHEQFVRMISPTLREPLGDMYLALEQLDQTANGDLGDGAFQEVDRQLSRLRLMINNLIRTADRVQKQTGFAREVVRVDEIVDRAVHNLATMAAARHVTINVSIAPDLPWVVGDEQRLTEAVQHLLHNAIKFNKIGGTVAIEADLDQEELQIHVRDTGVGMSPAQLERIWQGFQALPEREDRLSPGLGLMLTRFVARAHGGRVTAESEYGSGSIFCLHLPAARQRVLPTATASAP